MGRTTATKASKSEAADKVAAMHEEVAAGVTALVEDGRWMAMLKMQARFRSYSLGNLLLIMKQCPSATQVAGFRAWQGLGRQVRKGEKSIGILAPMTFAPKGDDEKGEKSTGEKATESGRPVRKVRGWRRVSVFDVAQTDGDALPQMASGVIEGEAPAGLWDALAAQVKAHGYVLERGDTGPTEGWTDPKTRAVRIGGHAVDAQAVAVLAHELGHIECGHLDEGAPTYATCRGRCEVEAESVAYVVATAHGIDCRTASFGYVAGWAGGDVAVVVRTAAETVTKAARRILAALDGTGDDETPAEPAPAAATS
ncbi:ArdC-like ssDNA-binding domain-containing protein [Pseudokineococcus sp. 5B2Z-1]|uniref:ArdC-like ssDNA-binding domain-containing protein n=1 Tax=Pseudokineococcus sp. 5B2Z-1 TaxID=3132744 RepID=UPI0030A0B6B8